jgi:protocatechuate 3,4-dioxygenase beta subunit
MTHGCIFPSPEPKRPAPSTGLTTDMKQRFSLRILGVAVSTALAIVLSQTLLGEGREPDPLNASLGLQQPPSPPQPPRDPGEPGRTAVAGKGSISGRITIAGTGQPARRARVSLNAPGDTGGNRSTTTDDNGRFTFSALPAGRFNLSVAKQGFVSVTYGSRRPGAGGNTGTPIQLAEGQRIDVQMQMPRGSVITGTAVDEHGEAIPGTPVRVFRFVLQSGQRTLQSAGSGQTDDRGVYRVYGLQPGDYIVSATPRNSGTAADAERVQAEIRGLAERLQQMNNVEEGQARVMMDRIAQLKESAPPQDDAVTGYAPIYYPGTTSPSSAVTVSVGPGEEKGNIDFQYQVVPIARVEGIVASPVSQALPQNIQINLINTGFGIPGLSPGSARADREGTFRIPNVPPGQYTIVARATINTGQEGGPPGRGGGPVGRGMNVTPAAEAIRMWATADVTVDGRNVSNIVLTLQPGQTLSGRVAFEGTTQAPADLTKLRVSVTPVTAPGTSGEVITPAAGRVDASGRFTIASVIPGRYRLSSSGTGNWFVGSSVVDGQDSLDFPIDVKPGQNVSGAVITFVDRQSELTGSIVDERGRPVSDYTLIVYPTDQRFWTPQSRRIQSARPATDGRYSFRNLPGGEYRIAPVLDPEPGSWFDPAFLQQLDNTALRVLIGDGEKKEQNLRVPGG